METNPVGNAALGFEEAVEAGDRTVRDESRHIVKWYGTSTDIEDRKQAEEKLRQDERELHRITDAIPRTIIVQDRDGIPIYANQALLDYAG